MSRKRKEDNIKMDLSEEGRTVGGGQKWLRNVLITDLSNFRVLLQRVLLLRNTPAPNRHVAPARKMAI
jgi:hypothetical protein